MRESQNEWSPLFSLETESHRLLLFLVLLEQTLSFFCMVTPPTLTPSCCHEPAKMLVGHMTPSCNAGELIPPAWAACCHIKVLDGALSTPGDSDFWGLNEMWGMSKFAHHLPAFTLLGT